MKARRQFRRLAVVASVLASSAMPSLGDDSNQKGKGQTEVIREECVGHLTMHLPGAVEAAATSYYRMLERTRQGGLNDVAEFPSGGAAGNSDSHLDGDLLVSNPLSSKERDAIFVAETAAVERSRNHARKLKEDDPAGSFRFEMLANESGRSLGYRVEDSYALLMRLDDVVLRWDRKGSPVEARAAQASVDEGARTFEAVRHAEKRTMFSVPERPGICLPYVFIPGNVERERSINVTYRWLQHPDVTISIGEELRDYTDSKPDWVHLSDETIHHFWERSYANPWRRLWLVNHDLHPQGIPGRASFMEVRSDEGAIDYAYYASIWKRASSSTASHAAVIVERQAREARSRGLPPVSKDEFLAVAEKVAESIRFRSVQ